MEYLFILLVFLCSALLLKWRYSLHLFPSLKSAFLCFSTLFVFGISWDYLGAIRGHWVFPGTGLLGIFIGPLPIEEFLFMIIVPLWIIVIYRLFSKEGERGKPQN